MVIDGDGINFDVNTSKEASALPESGSFHG